MRITLTIHFDHSVGIFLNALQTRKKNQLISQKRTNKETLRCVIPHS